MTDEFMIQVISKRMDEECPWTKGATVLKHQDWLDVVEHLWTDKQLKDALVRTYQPELVKAHAHWLLENRESESAGMPE